MALISLYFAMWLIQNTRTPVCYGYVRHRTFYGDEKSYTRVRIWRVEFLSISVALGGFLFKVLNDTEWKGYLVGSSVTPTDWSAQIIHFVRDVPQLR